MHGFGDLISLLFVFWFFVIMLNFGVGEFLELLIKMFGKHR